MNLVVGATGTLGLAICQRLRDAGQPLRALVRPNSPKECLLRDIGAEIAYGDLKEPDTLDRACRGATVVITTANVMISKRPGDTMKRVDRDGSLALLRAADKAAVRQFIYTSASPKVPANNPFIQYKREVETALRSSRLTWTILQPCAFMEIHAGPATGWNLQQGRARIIGSGLVPMAYIATGDVAAFAVSAVHNANASNRDLYLTGPQPLSPLDAVAIAERVTGLRFKVQKVPVAALKLTRTVLQPMNPILGSLLAMGIASTEYAEGTDMDPLLHEFGVQATTFEQFVRDRIAARASSRET
jgi:uncharacterized protein YbjT (DUF2867 family)